MARYVKLGSRPQNGRAARPIEWQVLYARKGEALVVSRYGLDCRPYFRNMTGVSWENSGLRRWLNREFLKEAFTPEEQRRIILSDTPNADSKYGTPGGRDTRDRVFCLSLEEAERYFRNDSERMCLPTALAKQRGACVSNRFCYWWLRSPGIDSECSSCVTPRGWPDPIGSFVSSGSIAVRPAMLIRLEPADLAEL